MWKKFLTKKGRREYGMFLIEGVHQVEEALKSDWEIEYIIFSEDFKNLNKFRYLNKKSIVINKKIAKLIAKTESSQGIFAVVRIKRTEIDLNKKRFVILDRIQDPGNLGTIIRTADASGFDVVFLDKESVDPFNPKVIRSSEGSIFHVDVVKTDIIEVLKGLKENNVRIYGTSLKGRKSYREVKTGKKVGIVFGNEARGIRKEVLSMCDEIIKIPIYGKAESLNVSVSTGIILYYFTEKFFEDEL